jgi:hypothetical protein
MSRLLSTISAACLALIVCAPAAVRSQATGQTDAESAASLRGGRHTVLRDNVVLRWNAALLQAVRNVRFAPPFTARALAITHTCMYDAWAAYAPRALGTRLGDALRRPRHEWTQANQQVAVSFAAYRALVDLFPSQTTLFDAEMAVLGLDPLDESLDPSTPSGIGNSACAAVLAWRHDDGSNQLGDVNGGAPYSDYTGYLPVNDPDHLVDPNRWQPLRTATGAPQVFLAPQWGQVVPFALRAPDQFRPRPPHEYQGRGYLPQADALVALSASLGDREKVIAEYWADGPATETPPGHWSLFAQYVSRRDRHDLDTDVKMFFVLGNALLDASIAVWDCKLAYDYPRPISAVRFLYAGQTIEAWAGPFQGTRTIPGEQFRSYIATPSFPEYTSGHSAFSTAGATVLRLFTGSPFLGARYVFRAGSSTIEPGATPATDVTLSWRTFDDAAEQAGLSRRYGGIHFRQADLESREMGRQIGRQAWTRALRYFLGVHPWQPREISQ